MATFDYSNIVATAKRLIDRFGKTLVLVTTTTTGEEWNPTIIESETSITGAVTSFNTNQIDGTLIKASDKQILTYNEVKVNEAIEDGAITYNVVNVDVIAPANDKILYKVQVRK